ncbi:P-loop containing nucleoside triphosphate hydrolase protein [Achaetomium macrosporum]|uniref:P-loop containing nucleoside triphosphate hydrolase protein n=1 Tax=Achaetomium macrosporum TaxID=79813 RepID=A0AAN7C969_9PEZI|nr:P-loop containing nucleoside triphosphate hydrolase protein [Achaetomium macrosporum]
MEPLSSSSTPEVVFDADFLAQLNTSDSRALLDTIDRLREIPDIITEAKEPMGIREDGAKKFSRDILRVEIAKPDVYPLTLVDLPGIFHSVTADQDLEGKEVVDQLIECYMMQPKSIILAVVAANNHLANQKVLQEARKHDPDRVRTIGVITKPDLAGSGPANERKYLDLTKGRENMHNLVLGCSISPANRGVESLRRRLSKVLLDHEELHRLGKAKSSTQEQRSYLLGVAEKYQRLARDAIEGSETKLRAELRNRHRAFHVIMETKDGRYKIRREDKHNVSEGSREDDDQLPECLRDLIEEYGIQDPQTKDESTLKTELQSQACFNQGRGFPGETNEELALQLFRQQAEPWRDIAWKHLEQSLEVTRRFVHRAFIHVIGADEKTQEAIFNCHANPFFDKKEEELRCKLRELLLPYCDGYGPPLEAEFISRMHTILQTFRDLEDRGSDEFGTEKVINLMTAYYEMSLRTFIDNVINLAVESCLVRDIPTILTVAKVGGMTPETLEGLASESEEFRNQRDRLQKEVEILTEGLRECQRHERRRLPG